MLKETATHTLARRLLRVASTPDARSDRDLLVHFASNRDEDAFAELVRRHGRMVLAVARRVTGSQQDAEDAFQAAFLVLARRAMQIKHPEQLANWLYGVAYRTALEARKARRRVLEHPVSAVPETSAPIPPDDSSELRQAIDEELARLPDKYRAAVVICDLEGFSRAAAATRLKIPEGTLSSRLAYARKMLANRLTRRGIHSTTGAIAALFAGEATGGPLPRELVSVTARVASRFIKGGPVPPDLVSPSVSHITEGVMKVMLANRIRLSITAGVLACGLVALGAIGLAQQPGQRGKQETPGATPKDRSSSPQSSQQGKEANKTTFVARGIEDEDVPYGALPMQAVVRIENGKLIIRRRVEVVGPVTHQTGNYTTTSYEHGTKISGIEISDPSDVAVFDMKGNRLAQKAWKEKLKMDVHVLLGFDGKLPNPRELTLFKEDTLLLILPASSALNPAHGHPPTAYSAVTSYVPQTSYVPRTTYVPVPNAPSVVEPPAPGGNYPPAQQPYNVPVNPDAVPAYPPAAPGVERYTPTPVPAVRPPAPSTPYRAPVVPGPGVETPQPDDEGSVPPTVIPQQVPDAVPFSPPAQPTPRVNPTAVPQSSTLPPTARVQPSQSMPPTAVPQSNTPPLTGRGQPPLPVPRPETPQSNRLPSTPQPLPNQPLPPTTTPQSNALPPDQGPTIPSAIPATPSPTSPQPNRVPATSTRPAPATPQPSTPPPGPVETSPPPGPTSTNPERADPTTPPLTVPVETSPDPRPTPAPGTR